MQSLCTLRVHCRQWPRNTHYQAGATPTLGPDFHRLHRTSLRLAHSLDHLVGAGEQSRWDVEPERLRSRQIENELELRRLHDWQVRRLNL